MKQLQEYDFDDAVERIRAERRRQDKKWGVQNHKIRLWE